MADATQILNAIGQGDALAAAQLLPLIYQELRSLASARIAKEHHQVTLQATALVHEAYIRLVNDSDRDKWQNRAHFFGAAAEAMRRILVESARRRKTLKKGGDRSRQELDEIAIAMPEESSDLLALDEALAKMEIQKPVHTQLVKLRFFAGLTLSEAAKLLDISDATADRYWTYAKAWLLAEIKP